MIVRVCGIAVFCVACALARGEVVVELVPELPEPYLPGQQITIHVWLRSEFEYDVLLNLIQFDFSRSDSALLANLDFAFDYSSIAAGNWGYTDRHPELPVPWTYNGLECVCDDLFLPLLARGRLHIGRLAGVVPLSEGRYQMESLNVPFGMPHPPWGEGGAVFWVTHEIFYWTSFAGEITGGTLDVVVQEPQIPAVSPMLAIVLGFVLATAGAMITKRNRNRVS